MLINHSQHNVCVAATVYAHYVAAMYFVTGARKSRKLSSHLADPKQRKSGEPVLLNCTVMPHLHIIYYCQNGTMTDNAVDCIMLTARSLWNNLVLSLDEHELGKAICHLTSMMKT